MKLGFVFLSIVLFLGLAAKGVRAFWGKPTAVENWIEKMPGNNEEPCDIIKEACRGVLQKIQDGSAPEEIIALYENMSPTNFGFWCHGLFCGYSKKLESRSAKACLFLKGILADYEKDLKNAR